MALCLSFAGGHLLSPEGNILKGDLHVAEGVVVDQPDSTARTIDCRGLYVLPGIVDLHGDAFELELQPRTGVFMDFETAMVSVDRQLISNGITTAYHGLSLSWEPGARSLAAGQRFMKGLKALRSSFYADHRVQIRWETFAHHAIDDVKLWLTDSPQPALAFNDHTTEALVHAANGNQAKFNRWAARAGIAPAEYLAALEETAALAPLVEAKIKDLADFARAQGATMLAHDEATPGERALHRSLGMTVSEFPLKLDVAEAARKQYEAVVFGGPNMIRGQSHAGNPTAEEAIAQGLCTVLASDYYYPSLLRSAQKLVTKGIKDLGSAWALISSNPAAALGLKDRGSLALGKRADAVVVDINQGWRICHVVSGGRLFSFG